MANVIEFPKRECGSAERQLLPDSVVEHLSAAGNTIVSASRSCQCNMMKLSADLVRLERMASLIENERSRTALQVLINTKRGQLAAASMRLIKQTSYLRSLLSSLISTAGRGSVIGSF